MLLEVMLVLVTGRGHKEASGADSALILDLGIGYIGVFPL